MTRPRVVIALSLLAAVVVACSGGADSSSHDDRRSATSSVSTTSSPATAKSLNTRLVFQGPRAQSSSSNAGSVLNGVASSGRVIVAVGEDTSSDTSECAAKANAAADPFVLRSTDDGHTWNQVAGLSGQPGCQRMFDVVTVGDRLVAVGGTDLAGDRMVPAVWTSDDQGQTWQLAVHAELAANERGIALDSWFEDAGIAKDKIFAVAGGQLLMSSDAGMTWQVVSTPIAVQHVDASGSIVAGTTDDPFRVAISEDGGTTWTVEPLPVSPTGSDKTIETPSVKTETDGRIFVYGAIAPRGGVEPVLWVRSSDTRAWTQIEVRSGAALKQGGSLGALTLLNDGAVAVFGLADPAGVWVSRDGMTSWSAAPLPDSGQRYGYAVPSGAVTTSNTVIVVGAVDQHGERISGKASVWRATAT